MKNLKQILKENIEKAQYQLKMMEGSIISHNYVVVFPSTFLTIKSDGEGKPIVNNRVIAAQFTRDRAEYYSERIVSGSGEKPIVMFVKDYYNAVISDCQETLKMISK